LSVTTSKTHLLSGETAQLHVTGVLANGSVVDLTTAVTGTTYFSSDSNVIDVGPDGEAIATGTGPVTILVINEDFSGALPQFSFAEIILFAGDASDRDGDGMPDAFEVANGLDPLNAADANQDLDGDELTNRVEFQLGTDPRNRDTDGDGLPDGEEVRLGLNPLMRDFVPPSRLNNDCTASILNRSVQVNPDGSFVIQNIPTEPGFFRVRVTCQQGGTTVGGQSQFLTLQPNGVTPVGDIPFGQVDPIPVSIQITSPKPTLTTKDETVQLTATATLPDGSTKDVTPQSTGTLWTSSNSVIASVSIDGLVTARRRGRAIIQARNEGVLASIAIDILIPNDADADGMPDEFERANGLNPAKRPASA